MAVGKDDTLEKLEAETGQMTISHAGQVIVFNNFPADKDKKNNSFIFFRSAQTKGSIFFLLKATFISPNVLFIFSFFFYWKLAPGK